MSAYDAFISYSHSSRNDDWTIALQMWLIREGWVLRHADCRKWANVSRRWRTRR